ncbi:MAG: PAS domain S-box protein, partial [Candidatus Omnitrophica bacterium]|nr:PAS domain S-box protein [Candidatus Omnitrophota bacterium]
VHPDDTKATRKESEILLAGGRTISFANRYRHRDGSYRWIEWQATNVKRGLLYASAKDITERKKAEEEKQNNLNLLTALINSTPDLIFLKDRALRTILCNDAYAKAVGKPLEEMYGHTDIENGWLPELVHGNKEKGIRGFENDDNDVLSGKTIHNPYDPANVDGEILVFDTRKTPLRNASGEVTGVLGIARDITIHKKAEAILANSQKEWEATFDAMNDGVSLHSPDHIVTHVNKALCGILNMQKHEILGRKCFELFHGMQQPLKSCPITAAKISGKAEKAEFFESHLGRWLAISVSPVFDDSGNIKRFIHSVRDITEHKNAEKKIKKHVQELEAFQKVTMGRERRVMELKAEVDELKKKLNARSS